MNRTTIRDQFSRDASNASIETTLLKLANAGKARRSVALSTEGGQVEMWFINDASFKSLADSWADTTSPHGSRDRRLRLTRVKALERLGALVGVELRPPAEAHAAALARSRPEAVRAAISERSNSAKPPNTVSISLRH
jgi:hypothetical protein